MRAVLELAGIHDILSKSLGSQNPINLVKATMAGLESLRTPDEVAELRGLSINQVLGLTSDSADGSASESTPEFDEAPAAPAGHRRCVMSTITVTQRKSRNGSDKSQLDTLRSLGLRRIGHTVEVSDSPQIRGMLHKVRHLIEVHES